MVFRKGLLHGILPWCALWSVVSGALQGVLHGMLHGVVHGVPNGMAYLGTAPRAVPRKNHPRDARAQIGLAI